MDLNLKTKIDAVIKAEGGDKFTNNPLDRGGPTKYGITQTVARSFGYQNEMEKLDYNTAFNIYAMRFWLHPKFDKIERISVLLAFLMFDWGVNSGPSKPVKALQRALNVLNRQDRDYPDVAIDGGFGMITQNALTTFYAKNGATGLKYLIGMMKAQRAVFYMELAEADKTQEAFENGWQSRCFGDE